MTFVISAAGHTRRRGGAVRRQTPQVPPYGGRAWYRTSRLPSRSGSGRHWSCGPSYQDVVEPRVDMAMGIPLQRQRLSRTGRHLGARRYRDLEAENTLDCSIEAPLEQWRAARRRRHAQRRVAAVRPGDNAIRQRSSTAARRACGITLEVIGEPVDYREAGSSLVIAVTTDAVAGETDWFDLGVTISIEGKQVPFVSVFTALASGQSHLLLPDGAYFALDKPELVKLRPAHRRGPRAHRCRRGAAPDQPIPGRVVRRISRARSRNASKPTSGGAKSTGCVRCKVLRSPQRCQPTCALS